MLIGPSEVSIRAGAAVALAQEMCLDTEAGGEPDPVDAEALQDGVGLFLVAAQQELGVDTSG